jgi:preprotein translocase subunit YajC
MTNTIFLMASSGAEGSSTSMIVMMVLMFAVFYFFMIRPQLKKQKEAKSFRESLATGSSVVTIGGVHGKIHSIQDTTIHLKVEDGTIIKVEKSAVISDFNTHIQQGGKR